MPHMLQRQLSRTLCDEYTNIFDDSLLSQSQAAMLVPMLAVSEVSSKASSQSCPEPASALLPPSPVSLKALETSSWSPSSVATPGYSPSSETDDSALLDSLSSPASPLFPVLQTSPMADVTTHGSISCSPEMLFAEDDDFFHNSFYRSLNQGCFQALPPIDTSSTPILDIAQKPALCDRVLLTTAAPSEIFKVNMNEPLSVDPFQLSRATTSTQDSEMSELAMETEKMASFVATLAQITELSQTTDLDDLDFASETSTLSDVSDDSDDDFVMASPVNNSSTTSNNKRKPSPSSKATKDRTRGQAKSKRPRSTVQKTPKVYPPRKPRTKTTADLVANLSDVIKTASGSDASGPSGSLYLSKTSGQKSRAILSHPDGGFLCDQCPGERFGRVHDLKRHQDSKHLVMTWPCDFCHRPFVRRDALLRHYVVKSARHDGIHPTESESHRLYEAKARAKARC